MKRKAIFFDIDGTLYLIGRGMADDVFDSIRKLKENGHIPIICTGRTKSLLNEEHLAPGFDYIIAGAGTYVEIKGEECYSFEMPQDNVTKLYNAFVENGFVPIGEGRNYVYIGDNTTNMSEENRTVMGEYFKRNKDTIKRFNLKDDHIAKISGVYTNDSNREAMEKIFPGEYKVVDHSGKILEFIPNGFSKAEGIKYLLDKLGIDIEDTYAFGDSSNDIEMIECVGCGCAMGNAVDELKEKADYVTDNLFENGISNALKHFGLI